jgi:hypothetical protein
MVGDQRDDAADEDGDGDVECGHHQPGAEQRRDQPGCLAHEVPVEAGQGLGLVEGGWRLVGVDGGGAEQALEKTEHA